MSSIPLVLFFSSSLFTMQTDSGFSSFFYAIPPFTRTYLVILLLTGFGGNLGLFDPFSLAFVRDLVLKHFEV